MSKGHQTQSHSSSQTKAAELQNLATHQERVGELAGDAIHLTPHEQTRLSEEHHATPGATVGHGIHAFGHHEIAALAYELWERRGHPDGSADQDWAEAVKELRSRNVAKSHVG